MNRLASLCVLAWLTLPSTGCTTIFGDFTVGTASDGAADDATVPSEAGSTPDGNPPDGSPSPDARASGPIGDASVPAVVEASVDATVDAAPDGGDAGEVATCVAGGSCSFRDCQNGTWACVDGGRVCQETTAFDAGTPCGVGGDGGASVCNAGQCVACNAGGDCSDPSAKCVKKTYDCSSGTGVCKVNGNAPDGTSCGMALYCTAGACAPCLVGTSCQPASNACHAGKITACTAGIETCSDLGMAAGAGTSCSAAGGGSGVCDGNGACVTCTPGAQCNPNGNQCQVGVQSCSGGSQCTNPVAVREGQTCGTGSICHNGMCAACDGTSCSAGCCDSHGCVATAQTVTECGTGTGGAACTSCSGPSTGSGTPVCSGNACSILCSGTTSDCNGACVNLKSDDDNCGSCGHPCAQGYHCNGAGMCSCSPATNPCGSNACGMAPDGCGGMVSCGTCAAPKVCSGSGGGPGTCGCTPATTCKSLGDNCGSFVDECKVTQPCGSCTSPDVCTTGANGAGTCSCKATDSCGSHGFTCGSFTDSCGNTPNCGSCVLPKTCSGANGGGGTCSCTPKMTCASLHANCGSFVDDCGNSQSCGTCAGSLTCSSTGPGTCECPSGTTNCSGTCASTASDPNNCGFCGNHCGSGLRCVGGSCTCDVTSCSTGCCSGSTCVTPKPLWYPDNDGDGYGDMAATGLSSCVKPAGPAKAYVTDHTDCCDADSVANPGYLAAQTLNNASPWQTMEDMCASYLWNCEPSGIPVFEYAATPCASAWTTCANNSSGNPVDCASNGCSAVCPGTNGTTTCVDYGGPGLLTCAQALNEDDYACTRSGTLCTATFIGHEGGIQACY